MPTVGDPSDLPNTEEDDMYNSDSLMDPYTGGEVGKGAKNGTGYAGAAKEDVSVRHNSR